MGPGIETSIIPNQLTSHYYLALLDSDAPFVPEFSSAEPPAS